MARRSKEPEAWKRALRKRKNARKVWMENKIRAATEGDWGAYRVAVKEGATGWEGHLAEKLGEHVNPHEAIHHHLQGVYGGGREPLGESRLMKA